MGTLLKTCGLISVAALASAPLASCLDPTEIVITFSTNAMCSDVLGPSMNGGIRVNVGTPGQVLVNPTTSIESSTCTGSGDLGSLVIVPSGSLDEMVAIDVVLSVGGSPSTCLTDASHCIFARRQIQFVSHRSESLPIELDTSCLGNTCNDDPSLTCKDGTCQSSNTTCDGGACMTTDASVDVTPTDALHDLNIKTIDTCVPNCNGQCVDFQTDKANCGKCGFSCTGGTCSGGQCTLDTFTNPPTCLGVLGGKVFVATSAGMMIIPTIGGSASDATTSTNPGVAVRNTATDIAWSESTSSKWIIDALDEQRFTLPDNTTATAVASNSTGFAWYDESRAWVWYEPFLGNPPTYPLYQGSVAKNAGDVAIASGFVYATINATSLCKIATQTAVDGGLPTPLCIDKSSNTLLAITAPSFVAVDNPESTAPNVFVVDSAANLFEYKSDLGTRTPIGSGTNLGAIAHDGTTPYVISPTAILKGMGLATVATATSAVTKCMAVDTTAVYWIESSGAVMKAPK